MTEPIRILFVDDEANIIKAMRRIFDEEKYEIFTATSGKEGLSILRDNAGFAVIVTDQRMPEMSGAEFLSKAKEIAPDALRIVLTGYADVTAAVDAINKGGAHRYLSKPWQENDLLHTVQDAVQLYSLHMENRRLSDLVRRQNEELKEWNSRLGQRVLEQTRQMRLQNENLKEINTRLKTSLDGTLSSFAALLELRDPSERHHSGNVAVLAVKIAGEIGLPPNEVETIRAAALLHDIGKFGGSGILLTKKPESMTFAERIAYEEHPVRGQTVVSGIDSLRPAGVLVRHHHEYWSGIGFPDALRGDSIPLGARIVGLADFLERSGGGRDREDAVAFVRDALHREANTRIDPSLVAAGEKVILEVPIFCLGGGDVAEIEVRVERLAPGMLLTRDVVSGTGVLLLRAGAVLDGTSLAALHRILRSDPSRSGLYVQGEKETSCSGSTPGNDGCPQVPS